LARPSIADMSGTTQRELNVQVAHTSELDAGCLHAVRLLLDEAFGADMTDEAWNNALGGMHALVWEAGELVAHGSVVQRRLLHGGRALRTGYLEGVAVRADRRGHGYGAAVMDVLERLVRGGYELGALSATDAGAGFYAARGWSRWRGRTWALGPSGIVRTAEEDDAIHVLELAVPLELSGDLTCDWREGDVW